MRQRDRASTAGLLPRMEARPWSDGKTVSYRYHPIGGKPIPLGTDKAEACFGTIVVAVIGLTGWLVAEILIARGVDPVVAWVGGMSLSALGWCWWWFSDENQV